MPSYESLNDEQKLAFDAIVEHFENPTHPYLIFDAKGGTGKTYTLNAVRRYFREKGTQHEAMTFTGRAASRLQARTCHSFLYEPVLDSNGDLIRWARKPVGDLRSEAGVGIIVDEGSMIPYGMHNELSEIGLPILYCGDIKQLPPVDPNGPEGFCVLDSLDAPVISLTQVQRFQENSGIYELTEHLRENNSIKRMKRDDVRMVSKTEIMRPQFYEENPVDIILCGMNKTRKKLNDVYRMYLGTYEYEIPQPSERVMCLKNDVLGNVRINNGEIYNVIMTYPGKEVSTFTLEDIDSGKIVTVKVANECWEKEYSNGHVGGEKVSQFAFGYAATTHKAQGSTFENVVYLDENVSFFLDQKRFRYTGASRASKMLYVAI